MTVWAVIHGPLLLPSFESSKMWDRSIVTECEVENELLKLEAETGVTTCLITCQEKTM